MAPIHNDSNYPRYGSLLLGQLSSSLDKPKGSDSLQIPGTSSNLIPSNNMTSAIRSEVI
jgi:hypothetical protein